ncbi:MAG: SRPBCC domain-containing protein [Rhizobacter sp.]|nr:SRPBCC domain-containing protein [Bacteriovorax sp.]
MPAKVKPNEINLIRVYDAPVKLVWDAWTDPKKAAKWWGPRGFTITTHSKDLRPGGHWDYTMHGPDGGDYPNVTKYFEVEKYSRLVYDHGGNKDQDPLFRVTVTFVEVNGKTTMDMTMAFVDEARAKEIGKFIKLAGGNSTWDRLGEYLEKEETGKDKFFINRSFNTSIDVMFDMWTNPEHFTKWLPPSGMTMKFLKADIKTGGTTLFLMTDGADLTIYNKTKYIEVSKPNRIVYTQEFCDEKGNESSPPWEPNWPKVSIISVNLVAEAADQTRVTVSWDLAPEVSEAEIAAFLKERNGMTGGWNQSFDKLEDLLT